METNASTAPSPPDAREAWHRLLQVSSRVLQTLDADLDRVHRMSVSEFDVLITLDNAPQRRLRMTELARAVMLSSGGLTRLVGRLEGRGLVQRAPDPADARAFHAVLTDAGAHALADARVTHDAVIARLVGAGLDTEGAAQLAELLGRVLDQAAGGR